MLNRVGTKVNMRREDIIRDIEAMDEVLERTANRSDIWQDRAVYAIARAIRDILIDKLRTKDGVE